MKITVETSRRKGCSDLVFREYHDAKSYLVFVTRSSAREVMNICEDLLMSKHLKQNSWSFEERDRRIFMEILPARRQGGRTLQIKSVSNDEKRWRRRILISEGSHGEGWLSFARKIMFMIKQKVERVSRSKPISKAVSHSNSLSHGNLRLQSSPTIDMGWKSFRINRHLIGGWDNCVVCSVSHDYVDWRAVGKTLVVVLDPEEDFCFYPLQGH